MKHSKKNLKPKHNFIFGVSNVTRGMLIAAAYNEGWYAAEVLEIKDKITINCMSRALHSNVFSWPSPRADTDTIDPIYNSCNSVSP